MNKLAFLLISGLFFLSSYYVGKKIVYLLEQVLDFKWSVFYWGVIGLLGLASALTFMLVDKNVGPFVGKIGSYWFAFLLTALVVFPLISLIYRSISKFASFPTNMYTWVMLVTFLLICLFVGYGFWQGQQIRIARYQVALPKSANSKVKNLSAVLISDVHLGYVNDAKKLEKIITKINELQPELVLISGDLFDGNYEALQKPEAIIASFKRLQPKYGTYLCWGNHDAGATFQKMKALVKEAKITLLEDEVAVIADSLIIAGRKDYRPIGAQGEKRQGIEAQLQHKGDLPVIVLDHQPSALEEYRQNVGLILSGHTHQGQVFPFSLVTNAYFTVDYGYYRKNENSPQVIVSSGVGTWGPPMRVGTQSELVDLTIQLK